MPPPTSTPVHCCCRRALRPPPPPPPCPGYVRHFRELERLVRARFPDAPLTFSGEGTPGATGWFEVSVNGSLVFSKKAGGACGGWCVCVGGAC